jgi:hypothetical protein
MKLGCGPGRQVLSGDARQAQVAAERTADVPSVALGWLGADAPEETSAASNNNNVKLLE